MKNKVLLFIFLIVSLTTFIYIDHAKIQGQVEYNITLYKDGSALWKITQILDINATSDNLWSFQKRILLLVNSAQNVTDRKMVVDLNRISITLHFSPETSTKKVEYQFYWINFSQFLDGKIIVGDVFNIDQFFNMLYGDGSLYVKYPSSYEVKEALPKPDELITSLQTLKWISAQTFCKGQPKIILVKLELIEPSVNISQIITYSILTVAITFASLFAYLKIKSKRQKMNVEGGKALKLSEIESDEEKVLKILRNSGGKMLQSSMVEQCGFSKAKTSQLLTVLEKKGVIKRLKRGRSKIVILIK